MKEWEKAQLEVEEEERKHNEEVQTFRQTHFKLKKPKLCVLVLHVLFFIFDFSFSLDFFLLPGKTHSRGDRHTPQSYRPVKPGVRTDSGNLTWSRKRQHNGKKCSSAAQWPKNLYRE